MLADRAFGRMYSETIRPQRDATWLIQRASTGFARHLRKLDMKRASRIDSGLLLPRARSSASTCAFNVLSCSRVRPRLASRATPARSRQEGASDVFDEDLLSGCGAALHAVEHDDVGTRLHGERGLVIGPDPGPPPIARWRADHERRPRVT